MIDLSTRTIKRLFEEQIKALSIEAAAKEQTFDFQFSERWL